MWRGRSLPYGRGSVWLLAVGMWAQQPVQVKIDDGTIQSQDQWLSHPDVFGDTYFWTGWAASAALMPVSSGLPIVGTYNDGQSPGCAGGSLGVLQLSAFSWTTPANTLINTINCMVGYSINPGDQNVPAGWNGYCSGQSGDTGCAWKSAQPYIRSAKLFLSVVRQISSGVSDPAHDATVVMSPDMGAHWCNPYDMASNGYVCNSSVWSATGAAPKPYGDVSYPGNIIWPALPTGYWGMRPIQYGQDGAYPSGIEAYCDPATYLCFFFANGVLGRWPIADMVKLDFSTIQYYTGVVTPGYAPSGDDAGLWSTSLAAGKSVVNFQSWPVENQVTPTVSWGIVYLKEFKAYVSSGYTVQPGGRVAITFMTAPHPVGPWVLRYVGNGPTVTHGFATLNLGIAYTVVSSDPPEVLITLASNRMDHDGRGTPQFNQYRLSVGPQPYGRGAMAAGNPTGSFVQNSGYRFSAGHAAGTFNRQGLVWAFDLMDGGSNNGTSSYAYYRDIANGAAMLKNVKGVHLAVGAQTVNNGDDEGLYSWTSDTISSAVLNIPASLRGNASATVAGVVRLDLAAYPYGPFWAMGDQGASTGNASIGLYWTGSALSLRWGSRFQCVYAATSTFAPTAGNWYFYATTVEANGATPVYHVWTGVGGVLTDIMAGVSRGVTCGSPTQTPAIAAGPLVLGNDTFVGETVDASYAGIQVFDRVIAPYEVNRMYQLYKTKLLKERGITVE